MDAASSSTANQPQDFEYAFGGGIAPPPEALPSTLIRRLPYDIFINHRGPDVKHTLATDIYNSLTKIEYLRVFLDSRELEGGDFLPMEIQQAMRRASLHIAIFSENYAQSPWCLAELSFMLKTATTIVPVFYHVHPNDLRWVAQGRGMYVNAFAEHENKGRYSAAMLEEWKWAIHYVSFYCGYIIDDNEDEGKVLRNIVNLALKLKKPFEVAKYPVGLDEAVEEFQNITLKSTQGQQHAQIVGIYGMGGSGKTTLAKELYNRKCSSIERCCFLFDVRAAKNSLVEKQKSLLHDLGVPHEPFDHIEHGKRILAYSLRSVRVLIILDDVDHPHQMDFLLPPFDSLGSGSLIIVTTRDLSVLTRGSISSVYKMTGLNQQNAEQLFCCHAFKQPHSPQEFAHMVKKFIQACNGLPLSLKVLGGQLCGNSSKDYWESLFNKISRILPEDILGRLKISYDSLDEEEQQAFLDIACFFLGEKKTVTVVVWDGMTGNGLYTWETLVNKCLVDLDEEDCIRMHDHLRDLGREIANKQSPYRIWFPEQIINVQKQAQERIQIRGIFGHRHLPLDPSPLGGFPLSFSQGKLIVNTSEGPCDLEPLWLGIKLLELRGHSIDQEIATLSKELVYLRWYGFEQRNLPSWLSVKNLRILWLHHPQIMEELWEANIEPPLQLRELAIYKGSHFQNVPSSIGRLQYLKKIIVSGGDLTGLPEEFCCLQALEHLELSFCRNLSKLPRCFGDLTNLRHLNLLECGELTLESDIFENMTKLEYLNLSRCTQVEELPRHITNQACLRVLYIDGMKRLREVPLNIGELRNLQVMTIGSPLLTSLPTSLGNLSSLTSLEIEGCKKLESLPESMRRLNLLERLTMKYSGVKYLPKTLGDMTNLETLRICSCPVREFVLGLGYSSTSSLWKLKEIHLSGPGVCKISISDDCCPNLEILEFFGMKNHHIREIEALPTSVKIFKLYGFNVLKSIKCIGDLVNLQKLKILNCPELELLPSFAKSDCLKEFHIEGCGKVNNIEGLESLETFIAHTSWKVFRRQSLEKLKTLELFVDGNVQVVESCIQSIQKLPDKMIICGRACRGVKLFVNSFTFAGLKKVNLVMEETRRYGRKCRILKHSEMNLLGATIVCFIVNCFSKNMWLTVVTSHHRFICQSMHLGKGKWVWIGSFTEGNFLDVEEELCILIENDGCEVEMVMLMTGQQRRVVEAFYSLLRLKNHGMRTLRDQKRQRLD